MKWPWQKTQEPELLRPSGTATIRISIVKKKDQGAMEIHGTDGDKLAANKDIVSIGMDSQETEQKLPQTTGKEPMQVAKRVKMICDITKKTVVFEGDRMWNEPYIPPKKNNK